jgi:hypothetical protein
MIVLLAVVAVLGFQAAPDTGQPQDAFSWEDPKATVLPTGDLEWRPEPFAYQPGRVVRYIDFDNGDDTHDGTTPATAWKHHPWDVTAPGRRDRAEGVDAFVFKRGVTYRGAIDMPRGATRVRLTSDPTWGEGEAVWTGARRVATWTPLAEVDQLGKAAAIPDPRHVWVAELDFLPRNVWRIDTDGNIHRLPLAREPDWVVEDKADVKRGWFEFDNPGRPHFQRVKVGEHEMFLGTDTKNLTRDPDFYDGAYVWTEYGWVMGTPYPTRIAAFFPDQRAIAINGQWGPAAGTRHLPRHSRYFLEDKPHYLDDPTGEFWFDRVGDGGRLFVRLPADVDPRREPIEVARHSTLIDSRGADYVEISGLTFRFTNTFWQLDAPPVRGPQVDPAVIRLLGPGKHWLIAHNTFEHVNQPVRMVADGDETVIDGVVVSDNVMRHTDHGGIWIHDGSDWGEKLASSRLLDVKVLRNKLAHVGKRPTRYGQGHAIDVLCPETAEIAGNVLDDLWGAGIFVYGGKRNRAQTDRPLTRILIHHNRVSDSMLNSNDWGGIETWQGGPAYVFNNLSKNPGGYKKWGHTNQPDVPGAARFGHAFYMDGGFKQYYFNNIAWGLDNDPFSPTGNTAGFQEIHGYLAGVFNNTVYNFVVGSRRQAPVAGRNKYLGNVWHSIGHLVFRHADPSDRRADPNADDAAFAPSPFGHATNAYAGNVFFDVPEMFGVFEADGRIHPTLDGFRRASKIRGTLGDVGHVVDESPLENPAAGDFRPTAVAQGRGVRVFVPWGLYRTVGEWHFHASGDDPSLIPDEAFHMAPYFVDRRTYHDVPTFPLRVSDPDGAFVEGPLEDWTAGALRLDGERFASIGALTLAGGPDAPDGLRSPAIDTENLLIEAYLRIDPESGGGLIAGRPGEQTGYALTLLDDGRVRFELKAGIATGFVESPDPLDDGEWHHVLAEADRDALMVRLYIDGRLVGTAPGIGRNPLDNGEPFLVGRGITGQIEFLRVAQGTLAQAKTTIEELHAWQFAGPFLRDFTGRPPVGDRDAGAIEAPPRKPG